MTEQEKEIKTIKERNITLKLSDADLMRLTERAEGYGLTVSQLLENFIGDLVGGTYSNGSDERRLADEWFDRCWFGMFPDKTFLTWAIQDGVVNILIEDLEYIQDMKDNIAITEKELNDPDYNWSDIYWFAPGTHDRELRYSSREEWESVLREDNARDQEEIEEALKRIGEYVEEYNESVKEDEKTDLDSCIKMLNEYRARLDAFRGGE